MNTEMMSTHYPESLHQVMKFDFCEESQTITVTKRQQPDVIWQEIYGIEDGRLKLIKSEKEECIPAPYGDSEDLCREEEGATIRKLKRVESSHVNSIEHTVNSVINSRNQLVKTIKVEDSIFVRNRGQIFRVDVRKNGYEEGDTDIDEFIKNEFAIGKIVRVEKEQYVVKAIESQKGINKTMPVIGLVLIPMETGVVIEVPVGSFIATPNDAKDHIIEQFGTWLINH